MDFYFYFSNFCLTNVTTRPYVFICPQTAKLPSLHQLAATAWMQSVTQLRTHQKLWFCFFPSCFLLVSGCLLSRFAEPSDLHKSFAQVEAFVGMHGHIFASICTASAAFTHSRFFQTNGVCDLETKRESQTEEKRR